MKMAMVFPGQGSQSVGMMAGFDAHPAVRETFDEASAVLGQDLWALVTAGPESDLNQTVNTQPVMLTAGVAVWRAWRAAGGQLPDVVAGHSLGEYSALVAAGALTLGDALPLVRFRAQAMQEAVPTRCRRDGGDPGSRRRGRRWRVPGCRRCAGRGVRQLQRTRADRDRRSQGSRRTRHRARDGKGSQTRRCCCPFRRRSTVPC